MNQRRSHRHWSAILGIAVFCGLSMAFAAAPLCSSVFSKVQISDDRVMETILEMAAFKMRVDISKAQGSSMMTSASKLMPKSYQKKYQELIRDLSGKYSKAEINDMILVAIQKLQAKKLTEEVKEKEARETQRTQIVNWAPTYVFKKRMDVTIPLDDSKTMPDMFHYFERDNSYLVESNEKIILYRPDSSQSSILSDIYARVKVSADESKAYLLDEKGKISIYDFALSKSHKVNHDKIPIDHRMFHETAIDVDPTGTYMLIKAEKGGIHIVNLPDGRMQTFNSRNSTIPEWTHLPKFIDSNTILSYAGDMVNLFNWKLNTNQSGQAPVFSGKILLSDDKTQVTALGSKRATTFMLNDISLPVGMMGPDALPYGYAIARLLPQKEYVFIQGTTESPHFEIYSVTDFSAPIFSFSQYSSSVSQGVGVSELLGISFSADGRSATLLVEEYKTKKTYIDLWQAE